MLNSFLATTSPNSQLCAYVSEDDPSLNDYGNIAADAKAAIRFGPRRTIVEVFNQSFPKFWDYDYYVDCNDDFVFKTEGWDRLLMKELEAHGGIGMAHGVTKKLPSAAMISRKCIEALGWWMYPGCWHQFIDNINKTVYKAADLLFEVPAVEVQHVHPAFMPGETGAAFWDETYAHVYSEEVRTHDEAACRHWALNESQRDIEKLKVLK